MLFPDGTILMHGNQPYDAAKAHEYYLRTRKLNPRAKGVQDTGSYTVRRGSGKVVRLSSQQLAEQKAYAAYRVGQIKTKLTSLNAALRKKMAEAKKSEAKAKKPQTAAEKSKAAREAKQYRNKHKQKLATKAKAKTATAKKQTVKRQSSVTSLKKQIITQKNGLKEAVAKQRELATAKKNG